jgi:hypothetical protein
MRTSLKGFSFFEVILYLALFSLFATALLTFSWDVLHLVDKQRTEESVFSDTRFVSEKLNALIRQSTGIDTEASVLENDEGKLVLAQPDSSDTITIEQINGQAFFTESGEEAVGLNSPATAIESLSFQKYGSSEDGSEYIFYILTVTGVADAETTPSRYQASATLQGGAFIRNSGL